MCIVSISAVAVVLNGSGKSVRKICFSCFFLRATELQISSAKNTVLLLLSFSRYCTRSFLTMMAGVGVAT